MSAPTREQAKAELRRALVAGEGQTNGAEVAASIATLSALNPSAAPAYEDTLLDGDWRLVSAPNFPGKLRQEGGRCIYTLGRLAFNMFQPTDLEVAIDGVRQPVWPTGEGKQRTHDIVVEFSTVPPQLPQLEGIVRNTGLCIPQDRTNFKVWFTGGILAPKPGTNLEGWRTVFGNPTRRSQLTFQERMAKLVLTLLFGLVPSTRLDAETGEIAFEMKRSPRGSLELLYLDQELRITKGEKGTVLICERDSS